MAVDPQRARLLRIALLFAALVLGVPAALYAGWGELILARGHHTLELAIRERALEDYLASERHRALAAGGYEVCVFGDSTHYFRLAPEHHLLAQLRARVAPEERERLGYYGLSHRALSPWDYYLLLHRVAPERPDLVILPVHLGAFSRRWLQNERYRFTRLERWLPARAWPEVAGLEVAGRRFQWHRWLLQRLDARLFASRAEPFLRGLARLGRGLATRAGEALAARLLPELPPAPAAPLPEPHWLDLETHVEPDHELFGVYRSIGRLAARHGIELLYYTTQINEPGYLGSGVDPRLEENLAVIRAELETGPGVHFLDLRGESPPRFFRDAFWHLSPEGVAHLARRLHDTVLALRAAHQAN